MRERARSSFRHVGRWRWPPPRSGSPAADDGPLSDEEMAHAARVRADGDARPDPSNVYADRAGRGAAGQAALLRPAVSRDRSARTTSRGSTARWATRTMTGKVVVQRRATISAQAGADRRSLPGRDQPGRRRTPRATRPPCSTRPIRRCGSSGTATPIRSGARRWRRPKARASATAAASRSRTCSSITIARDYDAVFRRSRCRDAVGH